MTHEELNAIVDGISRPLMEKLQAATQRITELEQRILDFDLANVKPAPIDVEAIAERAAALIKPPKDGQDAPPVDVDSIVLRVAELIPPPKDGRDAEPINADLIVAEVFNRVSERAVAHIQTVVDALPKPENGRDGKDGKDGRDATDGINGKDGRDGVDGKDAVLPDIAGMIDSGIKLRFADWAVDQERQAQEVFRRAIEAMPKPKDGEHGLGFEDMDILDDGAGTVTLSFKRGELEKSRTIRFPWQEHMGVWKEGNTYRYGNDVTWAGSVWRCLVESTIQKPGNGSSDWRLIVKRGEDGRPGKDGEPGKPGPQGERGRDLTQLSPDGRKY